MTLPTGFYVTNNQEVLVTFDTSMCYTLLDPGYAHSINPYFDIYKQ